MNVWEHLAAGDVDEATRIAESAYDNRLSESEMITLCACYLWRNRWESAYRTCRKFIDSPRWSTDSSFKFAGTAKWCAGDKAAAVAEWKQGMDVDYADMGGGITIPLHLFFVAAAEPELISMDEVIELLQSRLQAKPRDAWPGYLAKLLLGHTSLENAIAQSKNDVSHLWGDERRQAEEYYKQEAEFWWGVKLLAAGDRAGFFTAMKRYGELSMDDFDMNRELIIDKLRSSELYLARCEAERKTSRC